MASQAAAERRGAGLAGNANPGPERRLTSRMGRVLETSDPATLLASLARNIPGAIYRCALDRDWTMQLIGEEIERITGYPAEDFVESRVRTFVSLIHVEDRDRVERTVWEAVQAGRPFELEYRVVTASGEERWVLERGCAVGGGRQEWLDGIIFDITERRRFEEAARRASWPRPAGASCTRATRLAAGSSAICTTAPSSPSSARS
jgi:PAS domain S-box-containing protein